MIFYRVYLVISCWVCFLFGPYGLLLIIPWGTMSGMLIKIITIMMPFMGDGDGLYRNSNLGYMIDVNNSFSFEINSNLIY